MKQKVLMVLEGDFPPDDRVYKEAQSLIKSGFFVAIACYTFTGKPCFEVINNITIYRKTIPKLIYKASVAALKAPFYFNWWKNYLNTILSNDTYQIIHVHDLPLAQVGVYFKKKYDLKLVVDLHENWPAHLSKATHTNTILGKLLSSEKQWRNYEKTILQTPDKVVCVVEEMQQRIVALGIPETKTVVLPNTINPFEFDLPPAKEKSNDFVLFFAGGLNIERGLQYLIPAISKLTSKIPNIKLKIVGTGSYLTHLQNLVANYKSEHQVAFLGWKPLKEVMELTKQSDITLIPHLKWEQTDCSSPNKLFQCMYAGVPLIVSNCNSVARIVLETNSGVSYSYDNIDELAEKIYVLYQSPELRAEMAINGKAAVLDKYNWENTSKAFIEAYKTL